MRRPRTTIGAVMLVVAAVADGLGSYRAGRRAEQLSRPVPVLVPVTKSGSRYDRDGCRYLRSGGVPVELEEPKARYRPCSVCRPPL
jgi:hypothetical protein